MGTTTPAEDARKVTGWRSTLVVVAMLGIGPAPGCTCSRGRPDATEAAKAPATDAEGEPAAARTGSVVTEPAGLSAPISALHLGSDVVVVGLEAAAHVVRAQRIRAADEVASESVVFDKVAWSSEADLKIVPMAGGVAVMWRGLRDGRLVRQMRLLGQDLAPVGAPIDVAGPPCATRDAVWYSDGKQLFARSWQGQGPPSRVDLPRDKEVLLACGATRAFALIDEDDGMSVLAPAAPFGDAGAASPLSVPSTTKRRDARLVALLREAEFGDDEQRERADYTVGDELGIVRLATSGAIALRELRDGALSALRRIRTTVPRDADMVAVDASPRALVIVYTEDVASACPDAPAARVAAVRVDRATFEETSFELAPAACGRERGPFFTGAVGEGVSVAWVERASVVGSPRAPIAGLAYRAVPAQGAALGSLGQRELAADALVDAGCDETTCYAVALARPAGTDGMVPGFARVIRYR